ncbi:MAG: hypothetical protein KIS67_23805 [Verrucomicrobiae bacterium]|nr:hypothetical protein [Verrucomicrobiae bacterium]
MRRLCKMFGQRLPSIACLVALVISSFGCGSEWRKKFDKMVQDTKQQHKAADVQAALAPLFSYERIVTNHLPDGSSIAVIGDITNELPKEVTSLPIFADDPEGITVGHLTTNKSVLILLIGSGFGHWGIVVARPGHESEISPWHRKRLTAWEKGVYFYDGE